MTRIASARAGRSRRSLAGVTAFAAVLLVLWPTPASAGFDPDISGSNVVFRDGTGSADIWSYDLGSGRYTQVSNTALNEQEVAIAGNRAFYAAYGGIGSDFYLNSFDFGTRVRAAVSTQPSIASLSGDGARLVYTSTAEGSCGVFGFCSAGSGAVYSASATDSSSPTRLTPEEPETAVTPTNGTCMGNADVEGNYLIWTDGTSSSSSFCNTTRYLYAKNLDTGVVTTVLTNAQGYFQVSNGKIATVETEGASRRIILYDIESGARTVVATPQEPDSYISDFREARLVFTATDPDPASFSDRRVVWVHDLTTGEDIKVGTVAEDQSPSYLGRISGDWVVYRPVFRSEVRARNLRTGELRVLGRQTPQDFEPGPRSAVVFIDGIHSGSTFLDSGAKAGEPGYVCSSEAYNGELCPGGSFDWQKLQYDKGEQFGKLFNRVKNTTFAGRRMRAIILPTRNSYDAPSIDSNGDPEGSISSLADPLTEGRALRRHLAWLHGLQGDRAVDEIVLVGHSMGGLLARVGAQQLPAGVTLRGIVTVGTPHMGSIAAGACDPSNIFNWALGHQAIWDPACARMADGSNMDALNRATPTNYPLIALAGTGVLGDIDGDGVVARSSACATPQTGRVNPHVDACHVFWFRPHGFLTDLLTPRGENLTDADNSNDRVVETATRLLGLGEAPGAWTSVVVGSTLGAPLGWSSAFGAVGGAGLAPGGNSYAQHLLSAGALSLSTPTGPVAPGSVTVRATASTPTVDLALRTADGSLTATATLRDDGQGADQQAGDGTASGSVNLTAGFWYGGLKASTEEAPAFVSVTDPVLTLTGASSVEQRDPDGDGKVDEFALHVPVSSQRAGSFHSVAELDTDRGGRTVDLGSVSSDTDLTQGAGELLVPIPAERLAGSGGTVRVRHLAVTGSDAVPVLDLDLPASFAADPSQLDALGIWIGRRAGAYAGGTETTVDVAALGPVDRIEVSADGGATWRVADTSEQHTVALTTGTARFTGLAEGPQRILARPVRGGEATTELSETIVVVDRTAPQVISLDAGTSQLSSQAERTITHYAGFEKGGVDFETSLDGAEAETTASTQEVLSLPDGDHEIRVRARDQAGNAGDWASATVRIDATPPDTTLDGSGPQGTTNSTSASFTFSSPEPGVTFECTTDGPRFQVPWQPCTSPGSYSNLSSGTYSFGVRGKDAAGNVDPSEATRTWTVDATPPQTTIDSGPPSSTTATSASFTFHASESGSTFACQLDSDAWQSCTSPKAYSGLAPGQHVFGVRATDPAGNPEPFGTSRLWTVTTVGSDTTPPDTVISVGPPALTRAPEASFTFSSSEAGSTFECQLDSGAWAGCSAPKAYASLSDGSHTFSVKARDAAGNIDPSPATWTWTVDTTPPETAIDAGPSGTVTSSGALFSFSSNEPGSTFLCGLDFGSWTYCTSPTFYGGLLPGWHRFDVRATDEVGNQDQSEARRDWTIAGAPPPPPLPGGGRDTVAPTLALSVSGSQEAGRAITLDVACPTEACTARAEGSVSVPGAAAVFRLGSASAELARGGRKRLSLAVPAKGLKAMRKALKKRKKVRAKLTVVARDRAGNSTTAQRQLTLKR